MTKRRRGDDTDDETFLDERPAAATARVLASAARHSRVLGESGGGGAGSTNLLGRAAGKLTPRRNRGAGGAVERTDARDTSESQTVV